MMYGCMPQNYASPLEKSDHPENNKNAELDTNGIKRN
jgi:hypothetical protein